MCSRDPLPVERSEPWLEVGADGQSRALNLPSYATYYFTVITNRLSNGASRRYLKEFGVGVVEWRVMAMLTIEPGIPARRIRDVIGLDKSSVSRAVKILRDTGHLIEETDPADERRKILSLTMAGQDLHDSMINIALEREEHLLRGFSSEEKTVLLDMLSRIRENTNTLNDI